MDTPDYDRLIPEQASPEPPTPDRVLHGTGTELWHELVVEGAQRARRALGEDVESYMVFALMRHAGDAWLGARTLALDWLRAQEPPRRPDALRDVGDRCLLIAGLFPRLAERRRVNTRYYIELGRGAYAGAAERAPRCERSLFAELALAFFSMVEVLSAIRGAALPHCLPDSPAAAAARRSLH